MKRLIVNADDFGMNAAVTDAILECHAAGSVTSTTLMANTPDCERAARLAAGHPGLGVGLHFNLTWGRPIAPAGEVRSLLDGEGAFLSRDALARRLLTGRVAREDIDRELQAQWSRLRDLGMAPTHVDSHQHVHGFPVVFDAVAGHCRAAGIPMRVPWVEQGGSGLARALRRRLLEAMLARSTRRWRGTVAWNDSLNSIFDLPGANGMAAFSDRDYGALLDAAAGPVHELMVHAANDASAMQGYTRIGSAAAAEYAYLRRGGMRKLAASHGFAMGHYGQLA